MSSSHGLRHIIGRVLAWVTLLFAVGIGHRPAAAGIGRTVWRAKALGRALKHIGPIRLHPDHVHAGTLLPGSVGAVIS